MDILRGIAILMVIMHHSPLPVDSAGVFRPVALKLVWFGWSGVDLFFVLSGFLIGNLLFDEIRRSGTLNVRRFLFRRAFKIWPSYFCLLAASAAIYATDHSAGATLAACFPNLVHLQNYLGSSLGTGHTWSLAVEEHFYLALPLMLLLLTKTGQGITPPRFTTLAAGFLLCVLIVRLLSTRQGGMWFPELGQTHLRLDALLCGVLLAYLRHARPQIFARVGRHWIPLLTLAAVLMIPAWYQGRNQYSLKTIGLTMTYLSYACLLVAFVNASPTGNILGWVLASPAGRTLAWIGTLSYGIYLWHFQVGAIMTGHLLVWLPQPSVTSPWIFGTIVWVTSAIALGFLSTLLIERPMLALRELVAPNGARSVVQPTQPQIVRLHLVDR